MAFWNRKKKEQKTSAPRFETLRSNNMKLRVAAPVGEGWQRMEAAPKGGMLAGFKCIYGSPPKALALEVMLYAIAPGMPATLEALEARDWREHFLGKFFSGLTELEPKQVKHYSTSGFAVVAMEVTATGTLKQPAQPLRVIERYAPFAEQLLVVSVMGSPEQLETHAELVTTWLGHATVED